MVTINDYEVREELHYQNDHFWVRIENGLARFGATDYGQKSLREVVFIELPEIGSEVVQNEPYGTIESVKAVVDLIAPLSGTIKEIHTELENKPELINEDPYGEGWAILIEPSNLDTELKNLMNFDAAVKWYKEVTEG